MTMDTLKAITDHFPGIVRDIREVTANKFSIDIAPASLRDVAAFLFNDLRLRFITASAIDERHAFEILYHFSEDSTGRVITLRVLLTDREHPSVDSLSPVIHGTSWIEREMHELMGIDFVGNSNLNHLLLADDWPQKNYPLRQENRDEHGRK